MPTLSIGRFRCGLRALSLCSLALASLANLATPAHANSARPWLPEPGELASEPDPGLANLVILNEQLTIDLRALADGGPAKVRVTYDIENRGPVVTTPLQFISPGSGRGNVSLDGKAVAASAPAHVARPASWEVPASTPGLAGGTIAMELDDANPALAFAVTVDPGVHQLEVSYPAVVGATAVANFDYAVHQFAYLLAPARRWAGFGRLDISVWVPSAQWHVANNLGLRRNGATLSGSFTGIPADALTLSLKRPTPPWVARRAMLVGAMVGGLLALALAWWLARAATTQPASLRTMRWLGAGLAAPLVALATGGLAHLITTQTLAFDYRGAIDGRAAWSTTALGLTLLAACGLSLTAFGFTARNKSAQRDSLGRRSR